MGNWRVYTVGNTLKPLPIDSPESGDELTKKSHRKLFIFSSRKMISKKKFRDFIFWRKKMIFLENFPKIENCDVILFCVFFLSAQIGRFILSETL